MAIEQESRLREIALWMFVNGESIYAVRPWVITNEDDIWFTKKKDAANTIYARRRQPALEICRVEEFHLHSVRATDQTKVSVLGQSGKVLEYQPKVTPETTWRQESDGLHIRAMRAQRLYNNREWPDPVCLRLRMSRRP